MQLNHALSVTLDDKEAAGASHGCPQSAHISPLTVLERVRPKKACASE